MKYRNELEHPYPEALSVLRQVNERFHIGIIANQSEGTAARLAAYGMMPFVSLCLASTEEGLEKPNPKIFRLALERSGCSAEFAVMVGDRVDNDIRPAKILGWKTIRVLQGFAKVQQPRSNEETPDANVTALQGVVPTLKRLLSSSQR